MAYRIPVQISLTNLTTLGSFADGPLDDGIKAYIQSLRTTFQLVRSSTATPDGITVIATASGSGRWLRNPIQTIAWANQTAWEVNPTTGNDENTGAPGLPLATVAELGRRLRFVVGPNTYTVNIRGNIPLTDNFVFEGTIVGTSDDVMVHIIGDQTVTRTSTVTTATQTVPTANTQATIDDGVVAWTPGEYVIVTTGAQAGNRAWVLLDQGAGTARVTSWVTSTYSNGTAPAAASGYSTVSLTTWRAPVALQPGLYRRTTPTIAQVIFENIHFDACGAQSGVSQFTTSSVFGMRFRGCQFSNDGGGGALASGGTLFTATASGAFIIFNNCLFRKVGAFGRILIANFSPVVTWSTGNGVINAKITIVEGVTSLLGVTVQGGYIEAGLLFMHIPTSLQLGFTPGGEVGVFDTAGTGGGSGLDLTDGVTAISYSGAGSVYGSCGAGVYGARVRNGARWIVPGTATLPTITGALGDFLLDGLTTHIPPLRNTLAYGGAAANAPVACTTWATLAAAPFGGRVCSYESTTTILTRV